MSAPSAPQNVQATGGNTCATVWWAPPVNPGSSPVSQYAVTSSNGGDPVTTVAAPALYAVIGGLTNSGTPRTFTVTATNSSGTGPSSSPSNNALVNALPGNLPNFLTIIVGQLAQDYATFLPGSQVPLCWIGKKYLAQHDDAPRIGFVPRGGPWRGSTHLTAPGSTQQSDQVWERRLNVQAHVWGNQLPGSGDGVLDSVCSYGVAEQIANNLAATIHKIAPGTEITEAETWVNDDGSNTSRGAVIVLDITFLIPVTKYHQPLATIDSFPQTNALAGLPLAITPSSASVVAHGSIQFTAAGGTSPYAWSMATQPSGGSVSDAGLYTAGSTYGGYDGVTVTDASNLSATAPVKVVQPVTLSPHDPGVESGNSLQFTASGGVPPYTWAVSVNPSGGSIDSTGLFFTGPDFGVTDVVQATDSVSNIGTTNVSVGAPP